MKSVKLTTEKEVLENLKSNIGATIRYHRNISGGECYRIVDNNQNPLINVSKKPIENLLQSGEIVFFKGGMILNEKTTQFK